MMASAKYTLYLLIALLLVCVATVAFYTLGHNRGEINDPGHAPLAAISFAVEDNSVEPPSEPNETTPEFDWQTEKVAPEPIVSPNGYLARIQLNSPEELKEALLRAEQLYLNGQVTDETEPPAFILHGPEVSVFFKENYETHKAIVDLAARLSAFKVVDVRVCRTRMGILGREDDVLYPFVGTVPFGPAEIKRLLDEQNYVYF